MSSFDTTSSTPGSSQNIYNNKINSLKDLLSLTAEKAFQKIFHFKSSRDFSAEYNEVMTKANSRNSHAKTNARDWWELSSPTTQCNNVLGMTAVEATRNGTVCYICGLPLSIDQQHTPECEHVLPVYQAALLLKLYSARDRMRLNNYDAYDRQALSLEYKWSHRCCNQIKSDISFLSVKDNDLFCLHVHNTKDILSKIWNGGRDYCNIVSTELRRTYNNKNSFLRARTQAIGDETMNPIINFVNRRHIRTPNVSKGLFYLSILSNVILAADQRAMSYADGSVLIKSEPITEKLIQQNILIEITEELFLILELLLVNDATRSSTLSNLSNILTGVDNSHLFNKTNPHQSNGAKFKARLCRFLTYDLNPYIMFAYIDALGFLEYRFGTNYTEEGYRDISKGYFKYFIYRCILTNVEYYISNLTGRRENRFNFATQISSFCTTKINEFNQIVLPTLPQNLQQNFQRNFIEYYPNRANQIDNLLNYRVNIANKYSVENVLLEESNIENLQRIEITSTIKLINFFNDIQSEIDTNEPSQNGELRVHLDEFVTNIYTEELKKKAKNELLNLNDSAIEDTFSATDVASDATVNYINNTVDTLIKFKTQLQTSQGDIDLNEYTNFLNFIDTLTSEQYQQYSEILDNFTNPDARQRYYSDYEMRARQRYYSDNEMQAAQTMAEMAQTTQTTQTTQLSDLNENDNIKYIFNSSLSRGINRVLRSRRNYYEPMRTQGGRRKKRFIIKKTKKLAQKRRKTKKSIYKKKNKKSIQKRKHKIKKNKKTRSKK